MTEEYFARFDQHGYTMVENSINDAKTRGSKPASAHHMENINRGCFARLGQHWLHRDRQVNY
jgi:hypothetical protein